MRTIMFVLLALLLGGCTLASAQPSTQAVPAVQPAAGVVAAPATVQPAAGVAAAPATALTAADAAALQYMREEEKLARDIYQALYDRWQLPVFQNIAASEQTHTDAVKTLLTRYGIADPAAHTAAGVFTNPELKALYDKLLAQGSTSLTEALAVGAAIEEIDILDLQKRSTSTTPADIARVYTQLTQGSYNHLRAFVGQWEAQTGATYTPKYLSAADYAAIIAASGPGGGNGNGNGRGRRP